MWRRYIVMLLVVAVVATGCSTATGPSIRSGVDDAPQIIKSTFLTVARQAATLADY